MSLSNWRDVWNRRPEHAAEGLDLGSLIRLDGFDTGSSVIAASEWQTYADTISDKLGLRDGQSVYELGCGAGAFLFALKKRHSLRVGGLDYSQRLINLASRAMPEGEFCVAEAEELDVEVPFDYVVSNSVFQYFSRECAATVLMRMIKKAKLATAILDVPDLATRFESENSRGSVLGHEAYEAKYAGLEHTYFEREWFLARAQALNCSCEIMDVSVPNPEQSRYRFSVFFRCL